MTDQTAPKDQKIKHELKAKNTDQTARELIKAMPT
jgi:hypothetical protein